MMKYILTIIFSLALVSPVFAASESGWQDVGTGEGSNVGPVTTGIEGVLVSSPTASPAPGSYSSAQSVAITGGAGTQFIRYTTNSGAITCSSGATYSTPISVATSATIQAISCYLEGKDSGAVNFAYVISSNSGSGNSGGSSGSGGGGGGGTSYGGGTTATHSTGDANGDGKVDITDLSILSTQWTG